MRTTLLVLLLLAGAASASDSVWRWTDSNGVTHYSDRPVPGATKVELRSINQMPTNPAAKTSPSPDPASSAAETYLTFEVGSPAPEQSIVNTGGQVSIALRIAPALRPGHTVSVLLDGRPVPGSPGSAVQYAVKDVPRGEHTIAAVINDPSGQAVASAPSVRFYVRQTLPNNRPTGGAPDPDRPNQPNQPNEPNRPNRPNTPNVPNQPNQPNLPPRS